MTAGEIVTVGVTDLAVLAQCPLRLAFERSRNGIDGRQANAVRGPALMGIAVHEALEACARSWPKGDPREIADDAWRIALTTRGVADPDHHAGASVARARLMRASDRLWQLLNRDGPGAEVLPEERLTSSDGRVVGRADLIIRSPTGTRVVDFKTGHVLEPDETQVKTDYKMQIQIYAVLEHQATGEWPAEGIIAPLTGSMITIPIVPAECTALFEQLMTELDDYEDAPETQEARPAPVVCRWCSYAARCQKFWNAVDQSWNEEVLAIDGDVVTIEASAIGRVTMVIIPDSGSVDAPRAAVQADEATRPILDAVEPGSRIRVAGLRRARGEATFRLTDSSSLTVISS